MDGLAQAVCHWLTYKKASGGEKLLSEGALAIPIAETLMAKGWNIDTEKDYHTICNSVTRGTLFADFSAERQSNRIVIETKFFKKAFRNTVFNDVLRLSLPSESSLVRYLVVAWSDGMVPYREFEALLSLEANKFVRLDPHNSRILGEQKSFLLSSNKVEFDRICGLASPLNAALVECKYSVRTSAFNVALYAVSRG